MTLIDASLTLFASRLDPRNEDGRFSIGGTLIAVVILAVILVVALVEWVIPND
jgi:hypothetical protein